MSATTTDRLRSVEFWKYRKFTLKTGTKGNKGAACCVDWTTGIVQPAVAGTTLRLIGMFAETVDATLAAAPVNVDLLREVPIEWFANGVGGAVALTAADVGRECFLLDDQTVTRAPAGNALAGQVWGVDSLRGVAVEKQIFPANVPIAQPAAIPAYVTNNSTLVDVINGATYDVLTTAAATTITLPTAAADGTVAYFTADGTKNGHTIVYTDAAGSVALNVGTTASKRHLAVVTKRLGKWFANVFVSP